MDSQGWWMNTFTVWIDNSEQIPGGKQRTCAALPGPWRHCLHSETWPFRVNSSHNDLAGRAYSHKPTLLSCSQDHTGTRWAFLSCQMRNLHIACFLLLGPQQHSFSRFCFPTLQWEENCKKGHLVLTKPCEVLGKFVDLDRWPVFLVTAFQSRKL
jgi:hypothetical protein